MAAGAEMELALRAIEHGETVVPLGGDVERAVVGAGRVSARPVEAPDVEAESAEAGRREASRRVGALAQRARRRVSGEPSDRALERGGAAGGIERGAGRTQRGLDHSVDAADIRAASARAVFAQAPGLPRLLGQRAGRATVEDSDHTARVSRAGVVRSGIDVLAVGRDVHVGDVLERAAIGTVRFAVLGYAALESGLERDLAVRRTIEHAEGAVQAVGDVDARAIGADGDRRPREQLAAVRAALGPVAGEAAGGPGLLRERSARIAVEDGQSALPDRWNHTRGRSHRG